jgi:hypothetical protein
MEPPVRPTDFTGGDAGAMADLARKVHVICGELPLPQNAAGQTKPDVLPTGRNPDAYGRRISV